MDIPHKPRSSAATRPQHPCGASWTLVLRCDAGPSLQTLRRDCGAQEGTGDSRTPDSRIASRTRGGWGILYIRLSLRSPSARVGATPPSVGVVGFGVRTSAKTYLAAILVRVLDAYPTCRAGEPGEDCRALGPFQVLPALWALLHEHLAGYAPVDNEGLPGLPVCFAGGGGGHGIFPHSPTRWNLFARSLIASCAAITSGSSDTILQK